MEGLGFPGRKEGRRQGEGWAWGESSKVSNTEDLQSVSREAGEMAHQLKAFAALPKDISSDPSTYIWQLMTAYKSSSKRSNVLFWQPSTHRDTHMHK